MLRMARCWSAERPSKSWLRASRRARLSASSTRSSTRSSSAMIASRVNFSWPSRWCDSRGALMRTPTSSTICSIIARGSPAASMGSCAPMSSTMSARVNVGLIDVRCHLGDARSRRVRCAAVCGVRRAPRCARRGPECRPRASARHCSLRSAHASSSGLAGRVAFCAAASCAAVGSPSMTARLLRAHSRSRVERRDHALMLSRVDAGDLGHPGVRVDRGEFEAALGVQQMPQGGLVDDAGGFGFVIQGFGVDGDQLAVCSGLAVGHDDVGVQVRVAAPRGFVLVGDRHQPGQSLQVLVVR